MCTLGHFLTETLELSHGRHERNNKSNSGWWIQRVWRSTGLRWTMVSALKGAVVSEASSCEGNGAESEETVHWTPEGNLANANAESVEEKKNMKKKQNTKTTGKRLLCRSSIKHHSSLQTFCSHYSYIIYVTFLLKKKWLGCLAHFCAEESIVFTIIAWCSCVTVS